MKANIYTFTVLIVTILTIAGCKKDSKDESAKNSLKVDGTEYTMSKGLLVNYGDYNATYSMALYLLSSGLTVHELDGLPDSISGTGNIIVFEINTTGTDKLAPGDYTYSNLYTAGTFSYGIYMLNWNSTQNPDPDLTELKAGTVKIISSGATYELSFTGTDINDKAVSGYYKGALKYYTDFKKSGGVTKHGNKLLF